MPIQLKQAPKETLRQAFKETSRQAPREVPTQAPKEAPSQALRQLLREASKHLPKEALDQASKGAPREAPDQMPKAMPNHAPKEPPKVMPAQAPNQASNHAPTKAHTDTYVEVVTDLIAEYDHSTHPARRKARVIEHPVLLAFGLALLAYGGLFIRWTAHRVDAEMREAVFVQAKMVAEAVDFGSVAALTGTEDDLSSPHYQRLKTQLTLIRHANPACRFIYLMGRRHDGRIFFYVDSEDPDSPDYSPPGQIYDEATEADYRVFATGSGHVEGPSKDRWGVWISALTPVFRPNDRKMLAVLGMDFNASSWRWDILTRSALPGSSALLAFALGFYILAFRVRPA